MKNLEAPMTALGHQLPIISSSDDRTLCKVYRPVGDVFAETADASGGCCNKQPFIHLPGCRLKAARSGPWRLKRSGDYCASKDRIAIFFRFSSAGIPLPCT
jgi:hypothetical protein